MGGANNKSRGLSPIEDCRFLIESKDDKNLT